MHARIERVYITPGGEENARGVYIKIPIPYSPLWQSIPHNALTALTWHLTSRTHSSACTRTHTRTTTWLSMRSGDNHTARCNTRRIQNRVALRDPTSVSATFAHLFLAILSWKRRRKKKRERKKKKNLPDVSLRDKLCACPQIPPRPLIANYSSLLMINCRRYRKYGYRYTIIVSELSELIHTLIVRHTMRNRATVHFIFLH